MVKITIENLAQKEIVSRNHENSIIKLIHGEGIDWMHACGTKGRCTTCKMIVVQGAEFLSPLTSGELRYRQLGALNNNERLACQTRASGEIVIRVPDEYKLPHLTYTS
jgi:2Fe-2S ferredoxin